MVCSLCVENQWSHCFSALRTSRYLIWDLWDTKLARISRVGYMVNQHVKCRGFILLHVSEEALYSYIHDSDPLHVWCLPHTFPLSAFALLFLSCECLWGWHQCHLSATFSTPFPTHYINCSLSRAPAATENQSKYHTGCNLVRTSLSPVCVSGFTLTVNQVVCM